MSKSKETLVLGASDNPKRYSFKAIHKLRQHAHPVLAIGNRQGKVRDVTFSRKRPQPDSLHVDTVTLYLNAKNQEDYYDYILALHPKRIIFNPGAENPELEKLAEIHHIKALKACTLVLLSTGQF